LPAAEHSGVRLQRIVRRLFDAAITLAAIIYLTQFLLILAERGRERVPAPFLTVAAEALTQSVDYILRHPTSYVWQKVERAALELTLTTFARSAGLLLVALLIATVLGWSLGLLMASRRGRFGAVAVLILSILGTSVPSFLLAMFLWVINIWVHRRFGLPALPPTGFGWDLHLIMPALVLAARPLAQIAQVTYVQMSGALGQDYIRTAHAKGLSPRMVRDRHAIRNVLVPVLTTLGASLRYSLSSLPVVEYFFLWPGVGLLLLEAIRLDIPSLVTDLIVCLGIFFVAVNLALDIITPAIDPRLRSATADNISSEGSGLQGLLAGARDSLRTAWQQLTGAGRTAALPPLPQTANGQAMLDAAEPVRPSHMGALTGGVLSNLPLLIGTLLVGGVVFLAFFGPRLTDANPYQAHGVMMIEGEIGAPPYPPSPTFPWGTDHIGRDIQALVLHGARQTLILALFGMLARMLLGTALGALAGWQQGGRSDRIIMGAANVWAAFPATIFALLLIQGLGVQQGMWVFVVALCVVGWGEVAQVVRQQVINIKPQTFIEAARSVGASPSRILTQHTLPSLLPMLVVLGVLEMGGVLMLLAELGFLNIFLGGGFRVEIGEAGRMAPVLAYYSDVPEWGALLANIRNLWRSYGWMAWYAGVAFFLAILGFNLLGEGLRRFFERSRVNLGRLFGRYALLGTAAAALLLVWALRSTTPLAQYQTTARQFDTTRALADIERLASPEFAGRETGTPGAQAAAEYIAGRMEEIGLFPAGDLTPTKERNTFIQSFVVARPRLTDVPRLEIAGAEAGQPLTYREDFVERPVSPLGHAEGPIVGVALGPEPAGEISDPYGLGRQDLLDKVLIVPEESLPRLKTSMPSAILVIAEDPAAFDKKFLFASSFARWEVPPQMFITPEVADRLLQTAGASLADFQAAAATLKPGQAIVTGDGVAVSLDIPLTAQEGDDPAAISEEYYNVIGYIPGSGSEMQSETGASMDSQVIMVSAYYDGLGAGSNGTFYPGANDNASGVATLLEIARLMKESPYQPKRTVVFVAWAGGERAEGLSVTNIMNAKIGFSSLNVEAVMELSGVGAGDGSKAAVGEGSSFRLAKLFQQAASRLGVPVTARGRGPHYGMEIAPGFGGRDALTLYLSWDGSDRTAHTMQDTAEGIDPEKLRQIGEASSMTLSVLSREPAY
jgi:peptide/nickel transport system permease protein